MFTKRFWLDTTERAVKTFAEVAISLILIEGTVVDLNFEAALSLLATPVVLSILASVASVGKGSVGSASLVD